MCELTRTFAHYWTVYQEGREQPHPMATCFPRSQPGLPGKQGRAWKRGGEVPEGLEHLVLAEAPRAQGGTHQRDRSLPPALWGQSEIKSMINRLLPFDESRKSDHK